MFPSRIPDGTARPESGRLGGTVRLYRPFPPGSKMNRAAFA